MLVLNSLDSIAKHEKELAIISPEKHMLRTIKYLRRIAWFCNDFVVVLEPNIYWYAFSIGQKSIRIVGIATSQTLRNQGIASSIVSHFKKTAISSSKNITLRTDPAADQFLFWISQGFNVTNNHDDDVEMLWNPQL